MDVKIKKIFDTAVIPSYAKPGDAGMDLTCISVSFNPDYNTIEYGTGVAIEIPEGHVGLLFPRSSQKKKDLILTNHVGVIDSGYRGEIKAAFKLTNPYWEVFNDEDVFDEALSSGEFLYYEDAKDEVLNEPSQAGIYALGDRICQLVIVPIPKVNLVETDNLSDSERGDGGFGSTGN